LGALDDAAGILRVVASRRSLSKGSSRSSVSGLAGRSYGASENESSPHAPPPTPSGAARLFMCRTAAAALESRRSSVNLLLSPRDKPAKFRVKFPSHLLDIISRFFGPKSLTILRIMSQKATSITSSWLAYFWLGVRDIKTKNGRRTSGSPIDARSAASHRYGRLILFARNPLRDLLLAVKCAQVHLSTYL
jgi:hypothetical protein